eukprot:TRINITY_DN75836_c0_g1_i1.p2 TRINITY_DN75836_c0_g1~~TRINITY_DN75836_c0_g1_i1.p2  ORF type:complete len:132 (-),score=51.76 TRINITY_DN75836_c0_g1_i1:142-537(-)
MVSLGTQMKMAQAASNAQSAAGNAAASAGGGGDDDKDDEDDEKKDDKKDKDDGEPKYQSGVGEFLDDLMEGFSVIYKAAIGGAQGCQDCVRRSAYPVKEGLINGIDGVQKRVNPTVNQRGGGNAVPTFSHD